ncbi:putative membrane protein [Sphingomonas sp. UYAg733]
MNTILGTGFAATAALIAISGVATTAPAVAAGAKIHCYGVNTCKGTSDCKTAKSDCKGQNACKGQGFKEMTGNKCTAAGGSLTAPQ